MRDSLYLVSKGVPYELAMRMSAPRRLAFSVIFGEMDGGEWDWSKMEWRERKG